MATPPRRCPAGGAVARLRAVAHRVRHLALPHHRAFPGKLPPCSVHRLRQLPHVTTSKYSHVFGVPVALSGLLFYTGHGCGSTCRRCGGPGPGGWPGSAWPWPSAASASSCISSAPSSSASRPSACGAPACTSPRSSCSSSSSRRPGMVGRSFQLPTSPATGDATATRGRGRVRQVFDELESTSPEASCRRSSAGATRSGPGGVEKGVSGAAPATRPCSTAWPAISTPGTGRSCAPTPAPSTAPRCA